MRGWTKTALALCISGSLTACGGGSGGADSDNGGDIVNTPPATSISDGSSSGGSSSGGSSSGGSSGGETSGPILSENFGDDQFANMDRADNIALFSPDYKSVAVKNSDEWPSFYYPTCCYFDDASMAGDGYIDDLAERLGLKNDSGNPSLLIHNARFALGQTKPDNDETDPKVNSTTSDDLTTWGELDLSQDYRISFCVKDAEGSGKVQIYADNNTTGEANSYHGGGSLGSRIFDVSADMLVPGERVEVNIPGDTLIAGEMVDSRPALVGTATSFLQMRADSGATVIIDDLLIEHQDENGQADLPACNTFTPATLPDAPEAPGLFASDGQIAASWSSPIGAISFDIAYNTADDPDTATLIEGLTETSTTLEGLDNGSEYFVFLRVTNAVGTGDWSAAATATPMAPVGDNCVPTTSVAPSPTNAILWNVYDGCMEPGELGAVVINGSDAAMFDLADDEKTYFSASDLGVMTLNTIGFDAKPVGDLNDVIAGDNATYPKTFTWIARIDTSYAATQSARGFEIETSFGDANARRVKAILRPDSGKIQLEKFLAADATAEVDMDMSDGFHTYQVTFEVTDPAMNAENITATIYRDGVEAGSFVGDGRDGGSGSSQMRIGEGSSSAFYADVDWIVWSDNNALASLTADQLVGELPASIGELGSYAGADASLVMEETFSGPALTDGDGSSSNFFTAGYKALSSDDAKPFYNVTSGGSRIAIADTATDGTLSLQNARFSFGDAVPGTDTADTDASTRGDLDLSLPYTITFDVTANPNVDTTSGKCQVYVDNNTSSSSKSIHGGDSKIFEKVAAQISDSDTATGTVTISSDIGTATSFLQMRCDSGTTDKPVTIDNFKVVYQ
ncbi:fibronectin type III domain-containing protein [Microbulbifer hainanensis]|uniref:fibronectin type III domain-containing protein n=1 Tax=Microbulbifer hainanensis TaxID=2735675 RepID=UPI001865F2F8|nr:fibronectin type III domain-containing protein [Microbulbifer hainanensis]